MFACLLKEMQIKVEEENDETHDEREEKDEEDEEEEEQQQQRNRNELSELSDDFESELASLIINKVRENENKNKVELRHLFLCLI